MIKIENKDALFEKLINLSGTDLLLSISKNHLTFKASGQGKAQLIEYEGLIQNRDISVQYDLEEFKSLLRLAKKFLWDQIFLDESLRLYLSDSGQFSSFIKPLDKRIPLPGQHIGRTKRKRGSL